MKLIDKIADKSARYIATDVSIVLHLCLIIALTYYLWAVTDPSTRFALLITWLISVEATLQNILQQRSINNTHDDVTHIHGHVDENNSTPI